ncbi:DEAD-box ATP-dependent RNA helicase 17 [Aristolochia californica]|uniref:DEAD-box ATP-dependent RNA helicase 17 n=1 Tax=Aristolochia californica TaxID=171875 RepID=UPI0035DF76BD
MGAVGVSAPRETASNDAQEDGKLSVRLQYLKQQKQVQVKKDEKEDGIFASCSFADLGLQPNLCEQLRERMGFEVPTQVQAQSIPAIVSGRHVLINAPTGTGKTIVYLAPIIHHLQTYVPRVQRSDGTLALVLVPTRELCLQVYEILQKLLHRFHWIVPGYLMGGENRSKEKARLRKGISILVATPGRLLDHLKNTTSFIYSRLRWVVFDEADRILELGFGKEIQDILKLLASTDIEPVGKNNSESKSSDFRRQNLLLSATLNDKVNHLAKISLENPVMISLHGKNTMPKQPASCTDSDSLCFDGKHESSQSGPFTGPSVEDYHLPVQLVQRYVKVPCGSRLVALLSILRTLFERDVSQKIAVFFSTCVAVDFHYTLLSEFRWSSDSSHDSQGQPFVKCRSFRLHGNMEHESRRTTFQNFKSEKSAILLCTDVAARGLDFPMVRCIIQYDSPGEATDYVHRVGRTARLGKKGEALLFLQPVEMDYLQELRKHGVALDEFPLLKVLDSFLLYVQKHQQKPLLSLEMHPWMLSLQKALESFISRDTKMKNLAKDAFWSWVRAYTAHRGELKRIFMVKKLHLGHVTRSFALKEQPSSVGRSFQMNVKKRKKEQKQQGVSKKRRVSKKK